MKKKKVNSDSELTPVVDLKAMIHKHSQFFDKLVELIPARFYLPNEEDKPWFGGLSKKEKILSKKQTKKNLKSVRKDRLDPEKASTTTLDLLKQSIEKEKQEIEDDDEVDEDEDDDDDEVEATEGNIVLSGLDEGDKSSTTYEELRERLRLRIEGLRGERHIGCSRREQKRIERNERPHPHNKRKRVSESESESRDTALKKTERDIAEAANELSFGHVKLGEGDEPGNHHGKIRNKKKRKLSKQQELEKAKELREAKNDPERGDEVSKKHSWSAATSRALGVKVHDDPRLLTKSIQKEKRRQQKNAQKWKERVQTTNKLKADKQRKRSDNIQAKKDNKKQRKIDKREKKLMRPGFEGRKEGFVNQ